MHKADHNKAKFLYWLVEKDFTIIKDCGYFFLRRSMNVWIECFLWLCSVGHQLTRIHFHVNRVTCFFSKWRVRDNEIFTHYSHNWNDKEEEKRIKLSHMYAKKNNLEHQRVMVYQFEYGEEISYCYQRKCIQKI